MQKFHFDMTAPQSGILNVMLLNLSPTLKRYIRTPEELLTYLTSNDCTSFVMRYGNDIRINTNAFGLPGWLKMLSESEIEQLNATLVNWVESADERRESAYASVS